jgi:hypothetical protein
MTKKEWKKPEIRKLSPEEAARYWQELYKDYAALKLEQMERAGSFPLSESTTEATSYRTLET